METIQTRMRYYMSKFGITNKMLADESGIGKYTIDKYMQGVHAVDVEAVAALVRLCPTCDANWILTGQPAQKTMGIEERIEKLERTFFEFCGMAGSGTIREH